ncbi:hypothetical protein [Pararhodonellum marinum]|uniref:hypothetical protein n=1 Tax=Pararhodonellum marinum TaxID=2755358 RepID=UPI00188FE2BC|nr:hypothetical protein [Pararhodonellum marinum]
MKNNRLAPRLFLLLCCLIPFLVQAQDEDIFGIDTRIDKKKSKKNNTVMLGNVLGGIGLELSTGVNRMYSTMPFSSVDPSLYPIQQINNLENPSPLESGEEIEFKDDGFVFPFRAGIRINFSDFLSLGGGYGREWGSIDPMEGGNHRFNFEGSGFTFDRLYGTVGLVVFDSKKRIAFINRKYKKYDENNTFMQTQKRLRVNQEYYWRFLIDGEFGTMMIRKSFDPALTSAKPYYGFGLRIEKQLSEFSELFFRPAVEFRSFNYQRPTIEEIQQLNQTVITFQVGVTMRMPGVKKCKVPGCGVVMNHLHDDREYRGSSIFKRQNRKVGQWIKN